LVPPRINGGMASTGPVGVVSPSPWWRWGPRYSWPCIPARRAEGGHLPPGRQSRRWAAAGAGGLGSADDRAGAGAGARRCGGFPTKIDYRLTREGMIYLGAVLVVALAALNTGNNLLFMILACLLAGVLISGLLSRLGAERGSMSGSNCPSTSLPDGPSWRSPNSTTRSRRCRRFPYCW